MDHFKKLKKEVKHVKYIQNIKATKYILIVEIKFYPHELLRTEAKSSGGC